MQLLYGNPHPDAELVILWGINAAYTHINVMTLVKAARARGAHVVCIDPYRTRTARQADRHLMIRSGTDGALALGLMYLLIAEDRLDHAYIRRVMQAPPVAAVLERERIGLDTFKG